MTQLNRARSDGVIWTIADAAAYLCCSKPHVAKLAREQGLPFMRLGKLWRFRSVDVIAWAEQQVKKGAA